MQNSYRDERQQQNADGQEASSFTEHMRFPSPKVSECFRAYICRAVNKTAPAGTDKKHLQRTLLAHFRDAGMDVNAPARECLEAINLFRAGVQ